MMRSLGLLLFLSACSAAPPPEPPLAGTDPDLAAHPVIGKAYVAAFRAGVRIPAAFHGEWSSDPAACGAEGDDMDNRVWVDALTVSFQGEPHVATAVAAAGPHAIALTYAKPVADYHFRTAPVRLTLSADGKSLRAPEEQGAWQRCPAPKA